MKPIKCPNCGKRMESRWEDVVDITEGHLECTSCGVRGPRVSAECPNAVMRLAARLTREWIARMEADTNALVNHKAREVEYLTEKRCAEELRKCINDATNGGVLPLDELLEKWEVTP